MLFEDSMRRSSAPGLADAPVRAQIFLRAGQMAALDKLRTDLLNASAVTLQRHARGFVLRRRYARARRAAVTLQARPAFQGLGFGNQVCARAARRRHAAGAHQHAPQELCAVMQERGYGPLKAHARSFLLHSAFFCVHYTAFVQLSSAAAAGLLVLLPSPVSSREECSCHSTVARSAGATGDVTVQAGARGMAARSLARRLRGEAAALRIQSAWRRHVARARFLRVQRAVLAIQAAYRGLTARHVASDLRCGSLLHPQSRA